MYFSQEINNVELIFRYHAMQAIHKYGHYNNCYIFRKFNVRLKRMYHTMAHIVAFLCHIRVCAWKKYQHMKPSLHGETIMTSQ